MTYGIKETKDALVFGIACTKAVEAVLEDREVSIGDIKHAIGLVGPLKEAIKDGYMIPLEISDLDEGELAELVETAKPFVEDMLPDDLEKYVWSALEFAVFVLKRVGMVK